MPTPESSAAHLVEAVNPTSVAQDCVNCFAQSVVFVKLTLSVFGAKAAPKLAISDLRGLLFASQTLSTGWKGGGALRLRFPRLVCATAVG